MTGGKGKILMLGIAVAAAAWWWWPDGGAGEIVNAPPREGPIVAFGDSLTEGRESGAGNSYPDQLGVMLARPVINAGRGGDTISDAAARLQRDVLARDPSVVIVLLGGNDYLRRADIPTSLGELERIVRAIQDRGAIVVLVGLGGLLPLENYESDYRDIARRTGSVYVPDIMRGLLGNREMMADMIHPNAAGSRAMAERIADRLRPHLQ